MRGDISAAGDKIEINRQEQQQLNTETEQIGEHRGDGNHQPREVDFAEHSLIGSECGGCVVEAVGEIEPTDVSGHIEQRLGDAVGTHLGNAAENYHIHDHGKHWLYDVPQRTKDGLFVLHHDVAVHEKGYQVAVAPDFLEIDAPQLLMGGDDQYVFFFQFYL